MLFSSMIFLCLFLPFVLLVYKFLPFYLKNIFLLMASLIFYAWGEPVYVFLMIISIIINYLLSIWMCKASQIGIIYKKVVLTLSIIINLIFLGYFKYAFTVFCYLNDLFGKEVVAIKEIALPLGISFYTFQTISYLIDLYRGEIKQQKNIFNLALYISFFPQLVAGPIVKYREIEDQISGRNESALQTAVGIKRFIYGLSKKVIIANTIATVVQNIFTNSLNEIGTRWVWIGILLYTLQIYYDFSGYSDMAIGLGKMFGFEFLENFNYPYISKSIKEFWKRWHISLSTWFKEYLYIPLGGNRKGTFKTYRNLLFVFIATGVWHGATLNFLFWGLWHGIFILIERIKLDEILEKNKWKFLNHLYVIVVIVIGWAMFRCNSLSEVLETLHMMFKYQTGTSQVVWYSVMSIRSILIIFIAVLLAGPVQELFSIIKVRLYDVKQLKVYEFAIQMILLFITIMLLISGQYNPFIYFRF